MYDKVKGRERDPHLQGICYGRPRLGQRHEQRGMAYAHLSSFASSHCHSCR